MNTENKTGTPGKQTGIKPLYERNSTMQMLGKQSYYMYAGGQYKKGFQDIIEAHRISNYNLYDIAIDMFCYGIICGKRIERERKADNGKSEKL